MLMRLLHNGGEITLTEAEQSEVYEFYRLHCAIERIADVMSESEHPKMFKSDEYAKVVARRVLEIMADYHVSEDDAIEEVLSDIDYISCYTINAE